MLRCLFQEQGSTEAEIERGTAGALVLMKQLRRIEALLEALLKAWTS